MAYAAMVFYGSVVPVAPSLSMGSLDKALHLCEYFGLAWLLVHAMRAGGWGIGVSTRAWLIASGYGALLEVVQGFLPWRTGEWMDAVANTMGAALGVWIAHR